MGPRDKSKAGGEARHLVTARKTTRCSWPAERHAQLPTLPGQVQRFRHFDGKGEGRQSPSPIRACPRRFCSNLVLLGQLIRPFRHGPEARGRTGVLAFPPSRWATKKLPGIVPREEHRPFAPTGSFKARPRVFIGKTVRHLGRANLNPEPRMSGGSSPTPALPKACALTTRLNSPRGGYRGLRDSRGAEGLGKTCFSNKCGFPKRSFLRWRRKHPRFLRRRLQSKRLPDRFGPVAFGAKTSERIPTGA